MVQTMTRLRNYKVVCMKTARAFRAGPFGWVFAQESRPLIHEPTISSRSSALSPGFYRTRHYI